jgi:DNA-binding CsgD family transcriptional regulator
VRSDALEWIELLYAAAGNPEAWRQLPKRFAEVTREVKLLEILAPHLVRAFHLHNRIQGLETKSGLLMESLDRIQTAVVLVDSDSNVLLANKMAMSLFQRQNYIRLAPSGLEVLRTAEHKQLLKLIRGAVDTTVNACAFPGRIMSISRSGLERPLQVLVSPIKTGEFHLGNGSPAAVMFITDPESLPQIPTEWLRQLYGLSRAESRLAQLLMSGRDVKEASEELQVKESTVRSQLNSIFAKTRTSRQSELVKLLLVGPTQMESSGI